MKEYTPRIYERTNKAELARYACYHFSSAVNIAARNKQILNAAIAEGNTQALMNERFAVGHHKLNDFRYFQLDEFLSEDGATENFLYPQIDKKLLTPIGHDKKLRVVFNPHATVSHLDNCERMETAIKHFGGLDFVILGLGENGRIAFNEPGTPFDSQCHFVDLNETSRLAQNLKAWGGLENVPTRAVTMGIGTILAAKKILLMVSGENKAEILRRALFDPIHVDVPASALRYHSNVNILADREALSLC